MMISRRGVDTGVRIRNCVQREVFAYAFLGRVPHSPPQTGIGDEGNPLVAGLFALGSVVSVSLSSVFAKRFAGRYSFFFFGSARRL